jgi:hypothetical protein
MWVDPEAAGAYYVRDCQLNWWSRRDGCFKKTGETGIPPDPVAMAVALDPTIYVDASNHYVDDEVTSELTRGMTVVDRLGIAGNRRNSAVWKRFKRGSVGPWNHRASGLAT